MSDIPQIRKHIKFFANGKNKPLVDLATMVMDTEEVLAVLAVPSPSERNTCLKIRRDLFPLLPIESHDVPFDQRYRERNIMYDRIDISKALAIEFVPNASGDFELDKDVEYTHPVTLEELIELLNNKYGYDLTTDDITITFTSDNKYTITARPNSLQYFGQAGITIGTTDPIPPVKIPSHDSVWDATVVDLNASIMVNNNPVDPKDLAALSNAGLAVVQFKDPNLAWLVWTGNLAGEASFRSTTLNPTISSANVNQTLTITDGNLFAKYVPFTPNKTIPTFNNVVTAQDQEQTLFFTVPYAATLDKMVTVWIDDVETSISALLSPAGVGSFKLTMEANGDAKLTHDGVTAQRVQMRVNVATIPALIRSNSRFIYGIQRGGNNVPLDAMGHEVYNISFPKKVIIVADPSTITPMIAGKAEDYVAALSKINSGLTLPYDAYRATSPTIDNMGNGRQQLRATVESESNEARFPAFYFIADKDWMHLQSLPTSTKIGTYALNASQAYSLDITVGSLQGSVVNVSGGVMFCMIMDIPLHADGSFVLDYDPDGTVYKETTTALRFDITYSRASLITPRNLDDAILRQFAARTMTTEAIDNMMIRQNEVQRFVNQISSQWYANYEFIPYNPPAELEESIDDNGKYVIQLMSIPAAAMLQIQGIAAREPTAVIITLTDTGHVNDVTLTAMDITQQTVVDAVSGDGYLYFRHSKGSTTSNVRWTFRCDYDEDDLTYRQTTTILNITDSIIDNPVVPFNGIGIQECFSQENYEAFLAKVSTDVNYMTWNQQELLIASNSRTGTFVRYGDETPANSTVGRLLLLQEQLNWLRDGDFDQFPEKDPVIVKVTNSTTGETYDFKLSYLRPLIGTANGIPIRLPKFDDLNRLNAWSFEFKFFGFGNPSRPVPSPLPNLTDGTLNISVQCTSKPYRQFDSLFNFTGNVTVQEKTVMRNNLITAGYPLPVADEIVTDYSVSIGTDVTTPPPGYGRNAEVVTVDVAKQTPTFNVIRYLDIDPTLMGLFLSGSYDQTQLDSVVFKRTAVTGRSVAPLEEITLKQIRTFGINNGSKGIIPVVAEMSAIEDYEDPRRPSETWTADFSVLNGNGDAYVPRTVVLSSKIETELNTPPAIDIHGITGHVYPTDVKLEELAKSQWPTYDFSLLEDLDITANNNFGVWNVKFINKGKFGFEVVEFSDEALKVMETNITLGETARLFNFAVTSVDGYSQTVNYTAAQLKTALKGGRYLTIPVKAALARGDYEIKIGLSFSSSATTTNFPAVTRNNTTTVRDGTPPDITVDARWTLPANQAELDAWNAAVGLSPVTLAVYNMQVTQYNYTHNVIVEQSGVNYVAAIQIDKAVRERLIENRYPGNTIVGLWNSTELLASDLIDGLKNANGDNIILVRAAVNLSQSRYGLSFSVSGIADYSQIFTGIDVPIVQVSDVLTTAIQKDLGVLVANLRAALNPVADSLIDPTTISDKVLGESQTIVTNTLNELTRDNIGRTWVFPVGIEMSQLAHLKPGSWLVVKTTGGVTLNVNTTELMQKHTEGWKYTTGGKEYAVWPILQVIADRDDVAKQTFQLDAGASTGRWAPWFTNYKRTVNFEYSILKAKQTFVEVLIPDTATYVKLATSGRFPTLMDPALFNSMTTLGSFEAEYDNFVSNKEVNNSMPMFVRWEASQVDPLPNNANVIGEVVQQPYVMNEGSWLGGQATTLQFTKADIIAKVKIDGYYYHLVGGVFNSLDAGMTCTATFDYDGDAGAWLSTSSENAIAASAGYRATCVGTMNFAGLLRTDVQGGTVLLNEAGTKTSVSTNQQLLSALNDVYGLEAIVVQRWPIV